MLLIGPRPAIVWPLLRLGLGVSLPLDTSSHGESET